MKTTRGPESPGSSEVRIAIPQLLSKRVVALRTARGLDQAELARLAGVDPWNLCRLEKGQIQRPSLEIVLRVAIALGEPSIERLLGEPTLTRVAKRLPGRQCTEPTLKAAAIRHEEVGRAS
jgi:transcriptional regulator with XRE-family HTH domain